MGQLKKFVDAAEIIKKLKTEIRMLKDELAKEKENNERKEQIIQAQARTIQELGGYDEGETVLPKRE